MNLDLMNDLKAHAARNWKVYTALIAGVLIGGRSQNPESLSVTREDFNRDGVVDFRLGERGAAPEYFLSNTNNVYEHGTMRSWDGMGYISLDNGDAYAWVPQIKRIGTNLVMRPYALERKSSSQVESAFE